MEENQPTENCMKSLECSLCAPDSSLMVEIVDNRHIILCSLKLEKGTASFTDYMSSPRQCVTWKYEENRFTLYIKQKGRKTALYLDNQYLLGKNSVQSPQKLRITAFQIEIHSYEMTKFYKT